MVYEMLWRNKWITSNAQTIDDMIAVYKSLVEEFEEMKADGIILDPDGGTGDDYARLITEDKAVAEKHGLEEEEAYEEEDEFCDDDDCECHEDIDWKQGF